ncbi:MAG: ABC transporter ATP-binding protein [Planctomycetota bacterium]
MEDTGSGIEFTGVEKRFGSHVALAGLSLRVAPGRVYGLLGPNGAGKSTTIQLAAGLLTCDAGDVRVGGHTLPGGVREARATTAYVSESVSLYPQLSGAENLRLFSGLAGRSLTPAQARECLERAGLAGELHRRRVRTYSKGMRQKVGLAIALAKEARVLLLDEPSSGLDPSASHDLAERVRAAAADGVAILMATHDLFRARATCDEVGLLAAGRLRHHWAGDEVGATDLESVYLETVRSLEAGANAGAATQA